MNGKRVAQDKRRYRHYQRCIKFRNVKPFSSLLKRFIPRIRPYGSSDLHRKPWLWLGYSYRRLGMLLDRNGSINRFASRLSLRVITPVYALTQPLQYGLREQIRAGIESFAIKHYDPFPKRTVLPQGVKVLNKRRPRVQRPVVRVAGALVVSSARDCRAPRTRYWPTRHKPKASDMPRRGTWSRSTGKVVGHRPIYKP